MAGATRERVQNDYDFATDKVSELTRTMSLGVLAVAWLFIAGGHDAPVLPRAPNVFALYVCVLLVFLALLADYFQYLIGSIVSNRLLVLHDKHGMKELNYKGRLYATRYVLFALKQLLAVVAVVVLIVALSVAALSKPAKGASASRAASGPVADTNAVLPGRYPGDLYRP